MSNKPSIIALTRTVTSPYLSKYARAISISSASGGRSRIFQTKYNEENTPRKMSGSPIVFQMFLDTCVMNNFSSPTIKIWFEPMFFSGSFAVLSGAAPPPFRIFAGGFFRKNAFELIQEYCTRKEKSKSFGSPRFARRLICIGFWGQKRIGGFALDRKSTRLNS